MEHHNLLKAKENWYKNAVPKRCHDQTHPGCCEVCEGGLNQWKGGLCAALKKRKKERKTEVSLIYCFIPKCPQQSRLDNKERRIPQIHAASHRGAGTQILDLLSPTVWAGDQIVNTDSHETRHFCKGCRGLRKQFHLLGHKIQLIIF